MNTMSLSVSTLVRYSIVTKVCTLYNVHTSSGDPCCEQGPTLKVRKSQKQINLFSDPPKSERNISLILPWLL